jgi:hypothetical protein
VSRSNRELGAPALYSVSWDLAMTETIDKRAKRLGYPAELRSPMIRPQPLGLLGLGPNAEELLKSALWDRIQLLRDHYGIDETDPDGLAELAYCLAQDWVPGCQIVDEAPKRRGAPREVTQLDLVQLYIDIYQIHQERPEESIEWACTTYLRRNRNKAHSRWVGQTPRTLVNRYRDGKLHFEQLANQARRLDTLEGAGARFLLGRVKLKKSK